MRAWTTTGNPVCHTLPAPAALLRDATENKGNRAEAGRMQDRRKVQIFQICGSAFAMRLRSWLHVVQFWDSEVVGTAPDAPPFAMMTS